MRSSWFGLFLIVEVGVNTNLVFHESNHELLSNTLDGYSSGVPDLHMDLSSAEMNLPLNNINSNNAQSWLKFEPAVLDFQQRPMGIPYLQKVTLFNIDKNRSIDMKSISGNTVHFHSSFFEDKHIPPLGNTTFNVVFLGRDEGAVESDLLIHTTNGHVKYRVKGASILSAYRLRPIVGVKLPQNATFSPLIFLYNPHIEPIQVTEVYSSGGNFHLELPGGESESPKHIWEIPPLQTKAIIRINFRSGDERNHTTYIRFKLNNTESILAVPVEVEVKGREYLYTSDGFLDFGVGGTLDVAKSLSLHLKNSCKKGIKIDTITSSSKSIAIHYETLKVGSNTMNDTETKVATITIDWKSAFENKEYHGKLVVKYNNGHTKLEIPYYARVIEGNLQFDPSAMTYFINDFPKMVKDRDLIIKNNYNIPVAITNMSLPKEAEKYFYMSDFEMIILKPQEEAKIFTLHFRNDVQFQHFKLNSIITLDTNVSSLQIPLLSYNGKLHVEFPYKSKDGLMDVGLIGIDVRKEIYFVINNFNFADIKIDKISASMPLTEVEIIHCNTGNYTDIMLRNLTYTLKKCDKLKMNEFAILRLTVQSSYMEGQVWGTIVIETQFENLTIPVHYKVAEGDLELYPVQVILYDCFPGKICSHPLRIHSTFDEPMIIEKIVSIPPDPRFSSEHSGHIMARTTKTLGYIFFDPVTICLDDCYLGLNFIDSVGWLHTMMIPTITSELDLRLVNALYTRYLNETENSLKQWHNLTLKLDTSEVKWHIFETSVKMTWPSLVLNNTVLNFPLTQTGHISYFNITLYNPSDCNLVMQLVLSTTYPQFHKLNQGLPVNFLIDYNETAPPTNAFFFNEKLYLYRVLFKTLTGLDAHDATLPILLPPGKNFSFSLGFDAEEAGLNYGFLYIRNNLTVIEVMQLNGRSVVPYFQFGSRQSESDVTLLFEVTEKQLKECGNKQNEVLNYSVRRSFTAKNLGDIAIVIKGFYIQNAACEGYGFKVLNCDSFILLPNTSRRIDIGFMPDFTMTKIIRTLRLETSLNYRVSYELVATVPAKYLVQCLAAIERPVWEHYLYYIVLSSMCVLLIFVVGMIITDSEYFLKASIDAISRANATVHPPLDLRQVGAQTRLDIHSTHAPEEDTPQSVPITKAKPIPQDVPIREESTVQPLITNTTTNVEPDKYSVLVPTTGKSKKKHRENEHEDHHEKRKNPWLEARKLKNKLNVKEKKHKKENKKHFTKKSEPEDEETYSVSTDSSNTEEPEVLKIIGSKSRVLMKSRHKLSKKDIEDQSEELNYKYIRRNKLIKNREKTKSESNDDDTKHKVTKSTPLKENIEKRNIKLKLPMERKHRDKILPTQTSPTQFTAWGDSRAGVSGIESKTNTSLSHEHSISTETYKTKRDLGPIGSKKQRPLDYSNSFFTNGNSERDNCSKWEKCVKPTSAFPKRDVHLQSNPLVSSLWENNSNHTVQSNTNVPYPSSAHDTGNYLWCSSSVWKPWEPETTNPPTRTPPGFTPLNQNQQNVSTNQSYDLFGMSNIWAKQYPNPWNPNPKQN